MKKDTSCAVLVLVGWFCVNVYFWLSVANGKF